jgi:large subunit ribosomal protein L17
MRHLKAGVKLNRTSSHLDAMFRNMVTSLFKHERIRTTDAKAKELRVWADHLITLAKRGDLHARRQALAIVREKDVVHKLFEGAAGRYGAIAGGYTRLVKMERRAGDAAPMILVELVAAEKATTKKKKTPKSKAPVSEKRSPKAAAARPAKESSASPDAAAPDSRNDAGGTAAAEAGTAAPPAEPEKS